MGKFFVRIGWAMAAIFFVADVVRADVREFPFPPGETISYAIKKINV